jgi:hypothetical protein
MLYRLNAVMNVPRVPDITSTLSKAFDEYLPCMLRRLKESGDTHKAVAGAIQALDQGALSRAHLNQTFHRCSEAGMSEGFFRYYFLEVPLEHPYPVDRVFRDSSYHPPKDAVEIKSVPQFQWGLRRFVYDAMLYWGNFRQAYRELRNCDIDQIRKRFATQRVDEGAMIRRGKVQEPEPVPKEHRYLISENAYSTYGEVQPPEQPKHVRLALEAFRSLRAVGQEATPALLKDKTKELSEEAGHGGLFDLMYEDAGTTINSEEEVVALYAGQWDAFQTARDTALENTRIYLSSCNDLDVYVATSMRYRQDFRDMAWHLVLVNQSLFFVLMTIAVVNYIVFTGTHTH